MRYAPLVGLVMVLTLLAGALPAWAQGGNPAVTDEGNNIYLVDGAKGPIPNLLPAEAKRPTRWWLAYLFSVIVLIMIIGFIVQWSTSLRCAC